MGLSPQHGRGVHSVQLWVPPQDPDHPVRQGRESQPLELHQVTEEQTVGATCRASNPTRAYETCFFAQQIFLRGASSRVSLPSMRTSTVVAALKAAPSSR